MATQSTRTTVSLLTQQLAAFGLNPREWRIAKGERHNHRILHFENRRDEGFRLLAKLTLNEGVGFKVCSLQLASL